MAIEERFEKPVIILTGFGHPTTVSSSMEAYMFLADWPVRKQDASHRFVMETCLASIRGDGDLGLARALFASWCDQNDILAPALLEVPRQQTADSGNRLAVTA
ncbi:hypothetical protein J2X48_005196 [Bosea sp. BE271]|jgi:hypothetical protein|uniref:DUF982 domain-containing protein n=1 Tax=Bosea TaxID=85413 RepID=UPI00285B5D6B|nr:MULTISPECIES: DUF982 domain-containing protein [Bosea]MDR6831507.1 hypothetical protein [Bosea robiniae]MDR6898216.1 hypothetical protein [Bosea sp. BE109]MDR7141613.1 hypothetical protein [Bosea sp. BE168]MDR7178243.1 hypothetical protein [Bosea sp. BE271]